MKVFVSVPPGNPCHEDGLANEGIPTARPLSAASLLAVRLVWMGTKSSRLRISAHASSVILAFGRILSLAYGPLSDSAEGQRLLSSFLFCHS